MWFLFISQFRLKFLIWSYVPSWNKRLYQIWKKIVVWCGLINLSLIRAFTTFSTYMMTLSNGNIFHVTGHCAGNSPVPSKFRTQRPVTRIFDVFFDLRLNKDWVNNREAGNLRRYDTRYDVAVMESFFVLAYFSDICPQHPVAEYYNRDFPLIANHYSLSETFRSLMNNLRLLVTHIWLVKYTITGSDNGLSSVWCQDIYLNQCRIIINWTSRD